MDKKMKAPDMPHDEKIVQNNSYGKMIASRNPKAIEAFRRPAYQVTCQKEERMRKTDSDFLDKELKNIKGLDYIVDIPVHAFESINEFELFVKKAKVAGIGVCMHYETSNFYCGVVVQIYDKETCSVKDSLDR
jgi:hypothetical protein